MADVTRRRRQRLWGLCALVLALTVLASCGPARPQVGQQSPPTVAPVFRPEVPTSMPLAGTPGQRPTLDTAAQRQPTPTIEGPTDSVVASRLGNDVIRVPIYNNGLSADWSLENSSGLRYNLQSRNYVSSQPYGIAATPLHGAAQLFFTVKRDARRAYNHDQILGVSIMVNGGPDGLGHEDLLFTVMGSNAYTYYRENDFSVEAAGRITDEGTIFDEQRLYFLDFKEGIPPDTWGEVQIWLDERILDPEYKYLTGIYILTDERNTKTFYIDEVNLLVPAN
jgi:hypothetical protein